MPILDDCNRSIAQVWLLTRGQVITIGMGDIIDINHLALWKNIEKMKEVYEIENEVDCFIRVTEIFHYFLEIDRMAAKSGSEFEHEAR